MDLLDLAVTIFIIGQVLGILFAIIVGIAAVFYVVIQTLRGH